MVIFDRRINAHGAKGDYGYAEEYAYNCASLGAITADGVRQLVVVYCTLSDCNLN